MVPFTGTEFPQIYTTLCMFTQLIYNKHTFGESYVKIWPEFSNTDQFRTKPKCSVDRQTDIYITEYGINNYQFFFNLFKFSGYLVG